IRACAGAGGRDGPGSRGQARHVWDPGKARPAELLAGYVDLDVEAGDPDVDGRRGDGRQDLAVRRGRGNRDHEDGGRDHQCPNGGTAHHVGTSSRSMRTELDLAAGIDTKNVEPSPGSLSTLIRPPCISVKRLAMVRPMPVPRCDGRFDGDW